MSDSKLRAGCRATPVAIVDIGSNSVRLVAYEGLTRAPTPTFNEKALCGLGRGVATTGLLPEDAVAKALAALQRFRVLCDTMGIRDVRGHRHRGGARRRERPAIPRARRARDRLPIELLSGRAGGAALGARRRQLDPPGGRRRRRPRRRLARADRRQGPRGDLGPHAAARRPVVDGSFRTVAEEGGQDRARRRWPASKCCKALPAGRSTRSEAPGGRWPGCTCASASTR